MLTSHSHKLIDDLHSLRLVDFCPKVDKELLDAVRYHTTARADATLMDKILYIADYVSAERNFDGVEGLRKDLEKSLDLCYRNALQMSILELSQRLKPIHFDTFYAYNSSLME